MMSDKWLVGFAMIRMALITNHYLIVSLHIRNFLL